MRMEFSFMPDKKQYYTDLIPTRISCIVIEMDGILSL
jgi:hypothetical protein